MKSPMAPRNILGVIGALALAGMAVSALVTGAAAAPAAKVDLCHTQGNGSYSPVSVAASSVAAHLKHGDVVQPNGAVPGSPGYVFDSDCHVVSWSYGVNAAPDDAAQDPASPGNLFAGSGIPAAGFGLAANDDYGIELGLQIIYRQGPTVLSTDDYSDGVLHFGVASGPQSTANGSQVNNLNRAAWSVQYSVATGLDGATTGLGDYTFRLLIDLDPGAGTNYVTMALEAEVTPQGAGQSGFQWVEQTSNTALISDDEGNSNVTQNSQNYAFYPAPPYTPTFAGPATFDIILQALDGAQIIVSNHIVVDVAP